jgi:methionyl-tRNA synthetase
MIEKYCEGVIPAVAEDQGLASALASASTKADEAICALDFQGGIGAIMEYCKRVNGYVTEKEPWAMAKDPANTAELNKVLYNTAESVRALAVLLHPVMPETTQKLWEALGAQASMGDIASQKISSVATWGQLPTGSHVTKGAVLFPRLEEKSE